MARTAVVIWSVAMVVFGVLAGLEASDELANMLTFLSTFAAGGAFASLIAAARQRLVYPRESPRIEGRIDALERRLEATEDWVAGAEFDRRLRERSPR